MDRLEKLETTLKPSRKDLIGVGRKELAEMEDEATKAMILEEGRWLRGSNQKLRKRARRAQVLVRGAWGCLPPSKRKGALNLPNVAMPEMPEVPGIKVPEMPEMPALPKLDLPTAPETLQDRLSGIGFFNRLFGDTPRDGELSQVDTTDVTVTDVYISSEEDDISN